jgi:hypothetical protein
MTFGHAPDPFVWFYAHALLIPIGKRAPEYNTCSTVPTCTAVSGPVIDRVSTASSSEWITRLFGSKTTSFDLQI